MDFVYQVSYVVFYHVEIFYGCNLINNKNKGEMTVFFFILMYFSTPTPKTGGKEVEGRRRKN